MTCSVCDNPPLLTHLPKGSASRSIAHLSSALRPPPALFSAGPFDHPSRLCIDVAGPLLQRLFLPDLARAAALLDRASPASFVTSPPWNPGGGKKRLHGKLPCRRSTRIQYVLAEPSRSDIGQPLTCMCFFCSDAQITPHHPRVDAHAIARATPVDGVYLGV